MMHPCMEAITTTGLTKEYFSSGGVLRAVDSLSLSIRSGSVFGFLGPNGAGKTTTMKMLVGLARPSHGELRVGGGSPEDILVRAKIGFMPEAPSFYLYLTGREFLGFVGAIFGIEDPSAVDASLKKVDLAHGADRQIRTYSKGMLQRLGLAQALINDPEIVFLDEPLDGLDPLGRAEIKSIILGLKERGKTIFFNSHILSDVEEICDEVGILDKGKLVALGAPKKIAGAHKNLETAFVDIITRSRAEIAV